MSNEKRRPQVGETVWVKGVVSRDDRDDMPLFVEFCNGDVGLRMNEEDIAHIAAEPATAAPRQPWDVLREAADVMDARENYVTANTLRYEAKNMEHEATPPDPLDIVRRIAALSFAFTDHTLIDDARRCLAAREKKEV